MTTAAAQVDNTAPQPARAKSAGRWGARISTAAFCFFLVKGLAWLAVPLLAASLAGN